MHRLALIIVVAALAGCGARPIMSDSLRGPGRPVIRTRNYTRIELEDLKNRGHTYYADIRKTHAAVVAVLRAHRLKIERDSFRADRDSGQITTGFSVLPARPVRETLDAINGVFDEVRLTKGRYKVEVGLTLRSHNVTNVLIREYFDAFDANTGRWQRQFIPPGHVTRALFKQIDRRVRVIKNPSEPMWKNW